LFFTIIFVSLESLKNDQNEISALYTALAVSITAAVLAFIIIILTILGIIKSSVSIRNILKNLNDNDLCFSMESISNDEFGEFMSSLKVFLNKLNETFSSFNKNTAILTNSVSELSSSSIQITATAYEQSSSVEEIVNTMQDNRELSVHAAEKTMEVASLANHTQDLSKRGSDLRNLNENMMSDIRSQNTKIINIIKNLTDKLSRIDESVKLIDLIADNTKLIAFNAALEAASSGEAGARFSIIASEIRRFANNVTESASEINEKIDELNEASHVLLIEANTGTNIIDESYLRMTEQKEVFKNIVEASKNVAIKTQQISELTRQQESATGQVFIALKEISSGVNQFVLATNMTSATAERLAKMSEELQESLSKYHITDKNIYAD